MTEFVDAPVAAGEIDDPEATNSRTLVLVGVGGAVVLALLAYLLLGRGAVEETGAVVPGVKRPAVGAPAVKPKPVTLPKASNASLGRDPFRPLVSPAAPVVAGPVPAGATPTAPPAGGGATPPEATPPKATPTKAPAPATYSLRLTRVEGTGSNLIARFVIGDKGTVQYAKVGSRFGRTAEIKLLSLQSDGNGRGTAVIQVGESPFDVSTGDPAIFVQ